MNHKLGISTISMGWHPSHGLEEKITAAKNAGIRGIELYNTDLNSFAKAHKITRLAASTLIGRLCREAGIEIIGLGSFDNFEGQPTPLEDRIDTALEWMNIAHQLGTNVIQIPSNDKRDAIGHEEVIVSEFQALADLGARQDPPISIAYEALAWGTHVADWEDSMRVVQLVNRPNFGLCLDTYHVLSRVWADPRSKFGIRPGGANALKATLQRFRDLCPPEKIIYIQLSDAERLCPPLLPNHPAYHEDKDGTQSWCLYGRLFPLEKEKGAYFPMGEILKTWLQDTQWSGWVSMEVFHREMAEEDMGPDIWAERARRSWDNVRELLQESCG